MTPSKKEKSDTKSTLTRPINVDHIARIEGKAGIEVIYDGTDVEVTNVNVFEGPRYFEAITIGKPLEEAIAVFPRVCSFCAAAHKLTAIEAAENAIGLEPTEQTHKFRELLYIGDYLESHAIHLFLLVLPDFLGYADAFTMAQDYPDTVKSGIKMKDIGADIQTVIGSRYIHQENALIGGFGSLPTENKLVSLANRLRSLRNEAEEALEHLVSYRNWPEVQADRNHLALRPRTKQFTMYGNEIQTTTGGKFKSDAYKMRISETVVGHSFAKHGYYNDAPFMTGALSRYTLFNQHLDGRAKELAGMYQTYLDSNNPMSNNFAQALELVYYTRRAEEIARDLATKLDRTARRTEPKIVAGTGVSVTEAPRGLLAYTIGVDKNGRVNKCDIITPTAMFLPIMEDDLQRMAEGLLLKGEKDTRKIGMKLETVVRSYDPCVSCSVHVTKVK